jgi:hypothetical protein
MALPAKKPAPQTFPKNPVETALREWWARQEQDQKLIADPVDELQPNSGTVFAVVPWGPCLLSRKSWATRSRTRSSSEAVTRTARSL